jgi:DNA-binding GntR family transcriptional regulator
VENYNLQNEGNDKYSLRGRVFTKIREDILTGVYKKGDSIIESKISTQLGVSRTPVREALRQLELEELVTIVPNKGAVVMGINSKDIADIYMIRRLIEGLAARMCAENITTEEMDAFDEIIMLSEFHLEKGHLDQLYKLDNRFHELLYDGSRSRILRHVLSDFHHYAQRVRKESLSSADRAIESIKEHKMIVDAIRSGDGELAEKLTNEHVRLTNINVIQKRLAEHIQ